MAERQAPERSELGAGMIYLIGGPPRAGKSQLMQRFIEKRPMPSFSCDFLYDLDQVKQIEGFSGAGILEKGRQFRPTLEQLLINVSLRARDCVIEGEVILPEFIPDLQKKFDVKACFIGLSSITNKEIIDHGGFFNWPQYKLDTGLNQEVADLAERTIKRSKIIEEQAKQYNQQYFDLSVNYETSVSQAISDLLN